MNLESDPIYQKFLIKKDRRKSTVRTYKIRLGNYCKFTSLLPSELIDEAEAEEDARIRMRKRKIESYMVGFIKHMKDSGYSPNFIRGSLAVVRNFYKELGIELPNVTCTLKDPQKLITINDIPTKDVIRKALKHCNIKYKAIILLMMSGGMGVAEINHLTLKDYLDSLEIAIKEPLYIDDILQKLHEKEEDSTIPTWSIRRFKTSMPYVTFSSPESVKAINDYLDERIENGLNFKNFDDYLFENNGVKMHDNILNQYFCRLNDTCGFGYEVKGKRNMRFFHPHALRKFYASNLHNGGLDSLNAEWLIGHKVKTLTNTYIKPEISTLKKEYLKVLPALSLEDIEPRTVESDEFKELKNNYEKRFKDKDNEIADMEKKIENMGTLMEELARELQKQKN